ncbi:hypothetical protein [Rhodothermus profundi]|uniref:Uncharacterized protein n=1 Tax=Rhodothermus profundi TaxID=633813 RepID=A0A1M6SYB1_9BACT|nr:hypothetical protein [Rhodothermus profundi]SHK49705.1 hypothetical protein SAMN04488087_1279 [Rhodothermus profundi]
MNALQATPRALLTHLDELYRLAQLLTPDAETAVRLVRTVYREALDAPPPADQARTWLIARLLHHAQASNTAETSGLAASQELAERILSRVLPAAIALLATRDRLWLYLCDVLELTPETAASLLQDSPEGYTRAHQALRGALSRYLTAGQFALLEFGLSEAQIRSHLRQALGRLLQPPPGALRTELLNLTGSPSLASAPPSRSVVHHPATRTLVAVLIVLMAGLLGWLAWRSTRPAPSPSASRPSDLIRRSVELAASLTVEQPLTHPAEAERYLAQQGWRVVIPDIADARLIGLTQAPVLPELNVPVLLFEDRKSGHTLAIYLYTYALLDRYQNRLLLDPDVLRQIEEEQHFDLHVLGRQQVLVWRYRDDIYVAVTEGDAAALRERIAFPS